MARQKTTAAPDVNRNSVHAPEVLPDLLLLLVRLAEFRRTQPVVEPKDSPTLGTDLATAAPSMVSAVLQMHTAVAVASQNSVNAKASH